MIGISVKEGYCSIPSLPEVKAGCITLEITMKHLKLLLSVMAMLLASCSISSIQESDDLITLGHGDVEVLVPSSLRILAINGQPAHSPSLYEGKYLLRLEEGEQRIVVQYEENWNDADESGYIIKWQPVAIKENFKAGERYILTHAHVNNRDHAIDMVDTSPVWLIGGKQKITGELVKEETTVVQYVSKQEGEQSASHLHQLQHIWKNASEGEKKAFEIWLKSKQD